jgi:hypothetical protein
MMFSYTIKHIKKVVILIIVYIVTFGLIIIINQNITVNRIIMRKKININKLYNIYDEL